MIFSIEYCIHLPKVLLIEVLGEWLRTEDLVSMDRAMTNKTIRSSYWLPWLCDESLSTRGVLLAGTRNEAYLRWLQDRQLRVRILDIDITTEVHNYDWCNRALRSLKLTDAIDAVTVCDLQAPHLRHVDLPLRILQEVFVATGISACNIDSLDLHISKEDEKLEDCEAWICLFDGGLLISLNVDSCFRVDPMRSKWFGAFLQRWCLNLRFLSINAGIDDGDWIKLLDSCKNLVSLDCGRCKIHLHELLQRPWAASLTSLTAKGCVRQPSHNSECVIIPEIACLSTLCLRSQNDKRLRDADVMPLLTSCKGSLTSIDLRGCSELAEATALLAVEISAGVLTKLVSDGSCVTDRMVHRLADYSAACIQHLKLRHDNISDASIIYLVESIYAAPGGGSLTCIKLCSLMLTDASICRLAECSCATLTTVELYCGSFSDESILRIAECCVKIRSLTMYSSLLISDRSVVRLAELRGSQLIDFSLSGRSALTDASLDALARYCGVPGSERTFLGLWSPYFSDAAKERLRQLKPAIKF